MPHFSDPNQRDSSTPPNPQANATESQLSESQLKAGLAALDQSRYTEAIAHLEAAYQSADRRSVRLKAQMALVKAYERAGEFEQALVRCEVLLNSPSQSVREWAQQAMDVLEKRHGELFEDGAVAGVAEDRNGLTKEPDERQQRLSRSPFQTDASTLVDHPFLTDAGDLERGDLAERDDLKRADLESGDLSNAPTVRSSDPTGFVPLVSPSGEDNETSAERFPTELDEPDLTPPPINTSPVFEASQDQERDNPFSFDELLDNSDGQPDEQSDVSLLESDPQSVPQPPPSPHNTDFNTTVGNPVRSTRTPPSATVIDPELAASLNISKPRSSRRKPGKLGSTGIPSVGKAPERAKQWTPLKPSRQLTFWLSYGWTAIALVTLLSLLTQIALDTALPLWRQVRRIIPLPRWYFLETHTTWVIIIALVVLFVLSQWLLRFMLGRFYGVTPLPERELERRSPETLRIIKRVCKQHGFPMPKLGLHPNSAPFMLSYGLLPRTSRIVVSQGLLTQLSDDEIAALYGAELGHIRQRDGLPLMLVVVVAQIPFLIYRASAAWGDRRRNAFCRGIATAIASIAYSFFWMFRWPGLWLSRTRLYQGDRHSVSTTGNPNGLALALTKVATGMAQDIERHRSTDFILSGMEMLMPISPQQALTLGSVYAHAQHPHPQDTSTDDAAVTNAHTLPFLLAWDVHNPHRQGLLINNSHPLLGDRIKTLNQYAQQFRLHPAIVLPSRSALPDSHAKPQPFWIQAAPYLGAPGGMVLAIALWLVGGIAGVANIDELEWLWKDTSLLFGLTAIGFSFGTLLRLNQFFPEISSPDARTDPMLPTLLQAPSTIPLDSIPIHLEGRLLGRSGISNGMEQDLMLRTRTGTLKLHWMSALGPFGNLILGKNPPASLIGRSVTVTGWFRRGATPWVDAEKIRVDGRTLAQSSHPLWSPLLAIMATLLAVYVIYQGSL
jgi:Zn-dependent protease with chaperone function